MDRFTIDADRRARSFVLGLGIHPDDESAPQLAGPGGAKESTDDIQRLAGGQDLRRGSTRIDANRRAARQNPEQTGETRNKPENPHDESIHHWIPTNPHKSPLDHHESSRITTGSPRITIDAHRRRSTRIDARDLDNCTIRKNPRCPWPRCPHPTDTDRDPTYTFPS